MKRMLLLFFLLLNFSFAYAMGSGEDINNGNRAYSEGQYKDALGYYEKSESTLPESPYVYFNKGTAYYKLGDYEKAKEAFEKAAVKTKDRKLETLANYNLGNCQFQEGQKGDNKFCHCSVVGEDFMKKGGPLILQVAYYALHSVFDGPLFKMNFELCVGQLLGYDPLECIHQLKKVDLQLGSLILYLVLQVGWFMPGEDISIQELSV